MRNDLGVDLADLGKRLSGDKPYRMFTTWNVTTFAMAVRLKTGVIFCCAPYAKASTRELSYVLWREGDEHVDESSAGKYVVQYLMTALPDGSRYVTSRVLAEPAVAAVIRVVITSEAELGMFKYMAQKMLADTNIDKGLYAVVPHGTCYQTPEYKPSATGGPRSNIREVVLIISTPDSEDGNAARRLIRTALQVDRRGDAVKVQSRILACFNCLILPDLQTLRECPALDPNDHVLDLQSQFTVIGFKNNESVLSTMAALCLLGQIRAESITGIYIARGQGYECGPGFKKHTNDMLYVTGYKVLPPPL
jgi:hypothetical protein